MAATHLRTYARAYAFAAAAFLTLFGLLGFVPGGSPIPGKYLTVDSFAHYQFGLFPVNLIDNVHYVVVGLIGLGFAVWPEFAGPRIYARGLTVWYGLLAFMGLIPFVNQFFIGLMPVWGWDIALHFTIATAALFMGYWPFWLPNEAYDEGDADESGRPGVPKRPGTSIHSSGTVPLDRPTPRPAAGTNGDAGKTKYRPPRFDGQGNPIP